jgi:hypothetical protein
VNIRLARAFVALLALPAILAGCASIAANQPRFMDLRRGNVGISGYKVQDALANFAATDDATRNNRTKRQYRDDVVRLYLAAIEAQYGDFRTAVESEGRELNLGLDLAQVGYAGWASVAKESIVNELAAVVGGIGATRGAVNRNLYGERGLSPVLASLDELHVRMITRIEQGLARPETEYTLAAAFSDLARLETAASLSRASDNVTASAVGALHDAERELDVAKTACIAGEGAEDVAAKLVQYVDRFQPDAETGQISNTNLIKLTQIAAAMEVEIGWTDPEALYGAVIDRIMAGKNGQCSKTDLEALVVRVETAMKEKL